MSKIKRYEALPVDIGFQVTHAVFPVDNDNSICYCTSEERAIWVSNQLNLIADLGDERDAAIKRIADLVEAGRAKHDEKLALSALHAYDLKSLIAKLKEKDERIADLEAKLAKCRAAIEEKCAVLEIGAGMMEKLHVGLREYPHHKDYMEGCPICEAVKTMRETAIPALSDLGEEAAVKERNT